MTTALASLDMLESPIALRPLLGNKAPELRFQWSSDPDLHSLDDLLGRVVLLKFWVTGCGHCVASLPTMRALAARYKEYDVTMLGVTSIQGTHYDPISGRNIDTSGDANREFALMERFWPAPQRLSQLL